MSEGARNARQVSRFLDELVTAYGETGESIAKGIPLEAKSSGAATGRRDEEGPDQHGRSGSPRPSRPTVNMPEAC